MSLMILRVYMHVHMINLRAIHHIYIALNVADRSIINMYNGKNSVYEKIWLISLLPNAGKEYVASRQQDPWSVRVTAGVAIMR